VTISPKYLRVARLSPRFPHGDREAGWTGPPRKMGWVDDAVTGGGNMSPLHENIGKDIEDIQSLLSASGYASRAIDYFLYRPNMGTLTDANQITELTGPCGDTMKVYLKVDEGRIKEARMQVLGCPGAIASAMAGVDLVKGMTLEDAMAIKDRDIFRVLEGVPDEKQHCIRLTVKTLQKAIFEYQGRDKNVTAED
jgi:nitrogen fixation NifU-like protein